jgi:hypothetical protein
MTTVPFLHDPEAIVTALRVAATIGSLAAAFAAGFALGRMVHTGGAHTGGARKGGRR